MALKNNPAAVGGVGLGTVPKQQRGIEVRDRLSAAALAEFKEHGIEDSRVENIVEAAGTSWGTFFRYFPRKEDIYLQEAARQFRVHVRPVFDAGMADPERPAKETAQNMFGLMMEPRISPRFHAEMIAETVGFPARFAAILGDGELPVVAMIGALVMRGRERGEVRTDVPPQVCAMVLTAGVIFSTTPVLRAVAEGQLPGSEIASIADQAFSLAWDGLTFGT